MQGLSRAAFGAALMIFGAHMLAEYLIYTERALAEKLGLLSSNLHLVVMVLVFAGLALAPRHTGRHDKNPSPRYSGVAVVVITGIAALIVAGRSSYVYAVLIAAGTIVVAAEVWRFATTHAGEIGEARFPSVSSVEQN